MSNSQQETQTNFMMIGGDNVQLAQSIPLVLEKILSDVDNNSFYATRLISSSWNEAALSIFPKRPIKGQSPRALNCNKLFKSSEPNFDYRLLKSITFSDKPEACDSTRSKFLEFWLKNSNQIDSLALEVSDSFASTFSKMLSSNLKSLSLKVIKEDPHQIINLAPQFSAANLHTIEYQNCYSPTSFNSQMVSIICQAENLKRLKLSTNFIPDLNKNKKLQYLSFYYYGSAETFNHEKVSAMLGQVKDSLVTLKLITEASEEAIYNPRDFDIPKMPKLAKLVDNDISLQPLDKAGSRADLFEIISSKFPALKHLKLRDLEASRVQNMLDQLEESEQRPQDKIVSLRLEEIKNPGILVNFKEWFPNLKNLDIYLSRARVQDFEDRNADPYLGSVFSRLKDLELGLKKFILRMDWKFKLSDLVLALRANTEFFKGLSILELHTREHLLDTMVDDLALNCFPLPTDNYRKLFCDWLEEITRTVSCVVFDGFSFAGETSWELIHFIRSNNLPVRFINKNNIY